MQIGLSVTSQIPGLDGPELLDAIVARTHAARDAELASLHVGDKHGVVEPYAANIALASRLAGEWPGRMGVLVVSTMWNPVLLAEQLATLSAMVPALDVVVALGDGNAHFASVGERRHGQLGRFLDGLIVTRALLAGETVSADVGPYEIRDARVSLSPGRRVSFWLAASAPAAIRRSVKIADGWLASAKLTEHEALEAVELYRNWGGKGRAVLRRETYVGASPDDVAARAEPIAMAGHRDYPPEAILRGHPVDVERAVARFADAGYDELLARSLVPDQEAALASIARLGSLLR